LRHDSRPLGLRVAGESHRVRLGLQYDNASTQVTGSRGMAAEPIEYELGVPIPGRILSESQWARTAIKRLPDPGPLDWAAVFGRTAPVVLDLGCGNGRFLIGSALSRPTHDHLGIDILPVVIRYARKRGNQRGLPNLRFAVLGGSELVERFIAPGSVSEI